MKYCQAGNGSSNHFGVSSAMSAVEEVRRGSAALSRWEPDQDQDLGCEENKSVLVLFLTKCCDPVWLFYWLDNTS